MTKGNITINIGIGVTSLIMLFSVVWLGMIIVSKQKSTTDFYVYGIEKIMGRT
jgi:hypothetical protein